MFSRAYLVELGKQPLLSAAECAGLLEWQYPCVRLEALTRRIVMLEGADQIGKAFFDQLGGAIRAAHLLGQLTELSPDALLPLVDQFLSVRSAKTPGDRVVYGLSVFGDHREGQSRQKMAEILATVKNRLRECGVASRYIEPHPDKTALSSAQVGETGILDKGFELVIVRTGSGWLVGETCWIQDYAGQSIRDYNRPCADPRSGMLPTKLARIMVNLARRPETRTLLDPFCGSGGVLMEACLLGLEPTGLDRDLQSVQAARRNVDWLRGLPRDSIPRALFSQGDATQMRRYFDSLSFDSVVTEPYLGPPLSQPPTDRQLKQIVAELSALYREVLAEIRIVTRPRGRVVFVTPRFRDQRGNEHRVPVGSVIRLAGYRRVDLLSGIRHADRLGVRPEEMRLARGGRLSYSRPDQHVVREIHVLET